MGDLVNSRHLNLAESLFSDVCGVVCQPYPYAFIVHLLLMSQSMTAVLQPSLWLWHELLRDVQADLCSLSLDTIVNSVLNLCEGQRHLLATFVRKPASFSVLSGDCMVPWQILKPTSLDLSLPQRSFISVVRLLLLTQCSQDLQVGLCIKFADEPMTTRPLRARVRATFKRRTSARNPMLPFSLQRTALNMMTSLSCP